MYDASSPTVRVAAISGLSLLVSNPIAQTLLKALLPKTGRVLWDPSVQVRTAFIDLLISVQCVFSVCLCALFLAMLTGSMA